MNRHFVFATVILFLVACDGNKKLNQTNAEAAIKEVASNHVVSSFGMWERERCFNAPSIAKIEQLSQFSETEASSVVTFKCDQPFGLKFVFRKNTDGKWILTGLEPRNDYEGRNGHITAMVQANQNLNVVAQ